MTGDAEARTSASRTRLGFILLGGANFGVAIGYGIVLPFIPLVIERVSSPAPLAGHALHTGALLGIYPLAMVVVAPLWGRFVDRYGGRRILLVGIGGYAAALVAFALANSLTSAYLIRAAAGVSAGAVLPAVAATVGSVIDLPRRARLFAGVSVATLLGLLAGPVLSGTAYLAMQRFGEVKRLEPAIVGLPVAAAAAFVILILVGVIRWLPRSMLRPNATGCSEPVAWREATPFLLSGFAVLLGLGAFEAVLPLAGKSQMRIDTAALGMLLAGCMLVMLAVQLMLFVMPGIHRNAKGGSIAAGFLVMAAGSALLSAADSPWMAAAAVGLIAAGAAFLQPIIAYSATVNAGISRSAARSAHECGKRGAGGRVLFRRGAFRPPAGPGALGCRRVAAFDRIERLRFGPKGRAMPRPPGSPPGARG
ncbi:MAG: MFS transporter [Betaproteobacteria bacterium]|nr:MFS transporter [Betaproteobacteria bacterium]